jgi:hypothetical protein
LCKGLSKQAAQWADYGITGGIAGRSIADAHLQIAAFLTETTEQGENAMVLSQDLSKAFDRVSFVQAAAALAARGVSLVVGRLLVEFYTHLERRMEFRGAVAEHAVRAQVGLLQGCPLSPLGLIALMSWWHDKVQTQHVQVTSYFDDRTLFVRGPGAAAALHDAMTKSDAFDQLTGFKLNRGKCQLSFTHVDPLAGSIHEEWGTQWRRVEQIKVLGLRYDMAEGAVVLHDAQGKDNVKLNIERRAARIKVAARSVQHRKVHVVPLLLSVVAWAAPFAIPDKQLQQSVNMQIRQCLVPQLGPCASTLLVHTVALGEYALLSHWLRRSLRCLGTWVFEFRANTSKRDIMPLTLLNVDLAKLMPNLMGEMRSLGFSWQSAGGTWMHFDGTAVYEYGRHSFKVLDAWLDQALLRHYTDTEGRAWRPQHRAGEEEENLAIGLRTHPPLRHGGCAVVAGHVQWYQEHSAHAEKYLALGRLPAYWKTGFRGVAASGIEHGSAIAAGSLRRCMCGGLEPSASHLLWVCPETETLREQAGINMPRNSMEERSLCRIEHDIHTTFTAAVDDGARRKLDALILAKLRSGGDAVFATDGSEKRGVIASSWATGGDSAAMRTPGPETSSFAAELFAASFWLQRVVEMVHLHGLGATRRVVLFCDCQSVLKVLGRRSLVAEWWRWQVEWRSQVSELEVLGVELSLAWVPSHGKKTEWVPDVAGVLAATARSLNDKADLAAKCVVETALLVADPRAERVQAATLWSSRALWLAARVEEEYGAFVDAGRAQLLADDDRPLADIAAVHH